MNDKPFFSVVIPTYNCAELLQRSLISVFAQTFINYEIIVIDNSSTDNTQNTLNDFEDHRLNVITVKNEGIIAYSRNVGIEKAKGKWIAFLDSDDVWNSEKLEKVNSAINQNQEAILFCHDEWHVVNGKKQTRLKYGPKFPDMYERLLFKGNCVSTSAVCLSKDAVLKSGGFSERGDFVTVEDYEHWIRLAQIGDFFFIDEVLGEWHTHNGNYSSNVKIHAKAQIAVKQYHFDLWLNKYPNAQKTINHARGKMWTGAGNTLRKGKNYHEATKYAQKAISFYPFYWKAWALLFLAIFESGFTKIYSKRLLTKE